MCYYINVYMKNTNTKNKNNVNTNRVFAKNARPKSMMVYMERGTSGKYHVVGADYLHEVNQYASSWKPVDARNFTSELRRAAKCSRKLTVN